MCAHLRYASTMARFIPYTCLLAIFLCIVFGTALCMAICAMAICMAWHITYLFFGGRWRCCCLCVLFLHPAPLWSPLFVVLPACAARHATYLCGFLFTVIFSCFGCYGAVVLPMQVGLQCMVSYLRYISTVAPFVTYLFSPSLHLTLLCLLRRFLALRGIQHTCFSTAGGVVVVCVCFACLPSDHGWQRKWTSGTTIPPHKTTHPPSQ